MKQIKSLMTAALMLVMGIMMTSCLNSESESLYNGGFLAKVEYAGGLWGEAIFSDAAGNTYNASEESVRKMEQAGFDFDGVEMAFIYFKWSIDENGNPITPPVANTDTPQEYEIELVSIAKANTADVENVNTMEDLESYKYETAPITLMNMTGNNGNSVKFDFYGNSRMLYMYACWFLTNGQEEFEKHNIRLVYVHDELSADATDLKLYLCHDEGDDDGASALYQNWYGFRIDNALYDFEQTTGHLPTSITLSMYEDADLTGGATMPTKRTDYTNTYDDLN